MKKTYIYIIAFVFTGTTVEALAQSSNTEDIVGFGKTRPKACVNAEQRAVREARYRESCYKRCNYDKCNKIAKTGEWRCTATVVKKRKTRKSVYNSSMVDHCLKHSGFMVPKKK